VHSESATGGAGGTPARAAPSPPLTALNHIGLTVSRLDRSVIFYRDVLGLEFLGQQERDDPDLGRIVGYPGTRARMAFFRLPGAGEGALELLEFVQPTGTPLDAQTCNPGAAHLTFTVPDLHRAYSDLAARGVQFLSPPVRIETGVNRGAWSVYLLDPDDIRLALFQPPTHGGHHGLPGPPPLEVSRRRAAARAGPALR
jgi:lactoylglutathione lyase